jgi:D-alanyl-lipoteichoic acid acyltransferase DltB (MBOAT superfamily)
MGFTSLHFVFFLPVVFGVYWTLPHRWRNPFLLIASYYFYMSWNPWFGILLFGTSLIDWWSALRMETTDAARKRKWWLAISLFSNLGVLAAFKYSAFLYNTFEWTRAELMNEPAHYMQALLVPVGLSFYVFHSLSYTIDVYRRKIPAEKSFGTFALFVSFFPQLVAGPIARFNDLGVQFHTPKFLKSEAFISGIRLVIWGYFKKIVIADRLADFVNPVFAQPENYNGLTLLITGFFFVVQVYCDFSGYSDIAMGVARTFGFELKLNWRRPLLSRSLHEFWQRNHISMTTWFRDYVYISLGGSHVKFPRMLLNLLLVFLISGLWHGASWTFVLWGAMHGVMYIIEILVKGKVKIRLLGWPYLLLFHTISLIAFRANSFHDLSVIYTKIFSFSWNTSLAYTELRTMNDLLTFVLSFAGIAFLFLKELSEERAWFTRLPKFENAWRPAFYTLLFVTIFVVGQFSANEFIYFHF